MCAVNLRYKKGAYNCWCQSCNRKVKSTDVSKRWDGLLVCSDCYEDRQPQDFVRGMVDRQGVPFAAPEVFQFVLDPTVITGLLTADLPAGPENLWDMANAVHVQIVSGALTSGDPLTGANLIAVQGASGWEVLQYAVASMTGPNSYALSQLLRGRYGTELTMGASTGAPFVFIGQASIVTPDWLKMNLDTGDQMYSPVNVTAYEDTGDIVFQWVRRSRIPGLEVDNWQDAYFGAPLDSQDERYEVDILDSSGNVLRTLKVGGAPRAVYPQALHVTDFGFLQSALTVRVYQADAVLGRSTNYRQATLSLSYGPANDTLYDGHGNILQSEHGQGLTG